MKAIFPKITAVLLLTVILTLSLASCSKPPELELIRGDIERLIEASHEINDIFFGKGLETDERFTSPYENYTCVAYESGYYTVEDIQKAAETVYTMGYLTPLYEVTFTGKYDQVSGGIVRARYMDAEGYLIMHTPDSDDGSDPNNMLGDERRVYDYSTIKIIKPSRADYVTFTISSSKAGVTDEITLAIELTDVGWRLDYPTY